LSTVDNFGYLFCVFIKMEHNQIFKAEFWRLEVNLLTSNSHQFFPMPFLHEFGMKKRNQWEDDVHVLYSFVKGEEGFEILDLFVLSTLRIGLFGLHILNLRHEVVNINFIPESRFPGIELIVN